MIMENELLNNIQVVRDKTVEMEGTTNVGYSIGWGSAGKLQGDPMSRKELETLYILIGRALEEPL